MNTALIYLDPSSQLTLQNQIREQLVKLIVSGAVAPGTRLPSTRGLAEQLDVSRTTVVLAYQQLLADGFLITRQRSGIYANPAMVGERCSEGIGGDRKRVNWRQRLGAGRTFPIPPSISRAEDSFLDDSVDPSLYPLAQWREVSRLALASREIREWSARSREVDDPMLIEQIRTKILPRRGIRAAPEEILITVGAQQALGLLVQLLVDRGTLVAVEDPGYPDFRDLLALREANVIHQPLDHEGVSVDERLDGCEIIYTTPSHQVPTAVTMSTDRRERLLAKAIEQDAIVIEDDADSERNHLGQPHPALRGMDRTGRVIYVSSLSKVLAPWLRLGFMVGSPELIAAARELRRITVRHPPPHDQRATALFLALGYYDSMLVHLGQIFRERWIAMRDALNHYLQRSVVTAPATGGTTCWIQGPPELDAEQLVSQAARRGVHIEEVSRYFATPVKPRNCFRMSIRGIPVGRIRPAVAKLADLVRDIDEGLAERLDSARGRRLEGQELNRAMCGSRIRLETVYGDPCTIDLMSDGNMVGRAGYADEDCDTGRWWIEGDRWFRQWKSWAYGETIGYFAVLDGAAIKWFNDDGRLVSRAILEPAAAGR
jgi:GntR family transcriptional regulator / MocR family aminotransferase